MALAFAHFGISNDGKMMSPAYFVRQVDELLPRSLLYLALIHIRLKGSAVRSADIIENYVQMNMVGIGMDGKEILILAFEEFLAKLLADFQRSFRCDFTGLEALNEVLREDGIQACST